MGLSVDTSLAKFMCSSPLTRKRNDWIYILNSLLCDLLCKWASLVAQMVKNLSSMQETWVWSLYWEDPLEKEMATPSSVLVWRITWTEEPGGLQSMESQRIRYSWVTNFHFQGGLVSFLYEFRGFFFFFFFLPFCYSFLLVWPNHYQSHSSANIYSSSDVPSAEKHRDKYSFRGIRSNEGGAAETQQWERV